MEAIQVFDRPASQAFYSVAGRLLFIETLDLQLRNLIELLFAGWQLSPVSFSDTSPDICISFFRDAAPEIPEGLQQFEIAHGGHCYTRGAELYLALGDSLLHLTGGTPVTVDVCMKELPAPEDPLPARIVSFAVCAALRRFGLFDVHSAGVVNPESGAGILIVGPSGSGKSTLALQLVQAGWPYLSDDELLLSFADDRVEARGFRSFFAVTGAPDSAFKTCFEPDIAYGTRRLELALPRLLLFTRVSGEEKTQLGKLTQAETMMRLIKACPWATYDTAIAGDNLTLLSALARQVSAFDFSAGRDLLAPGFAAELLDKISRM